MFYSTKQFPIEHWDLGGNHYDDEFMYHEWLCPLGEAPWPSETKAEIVKILNLACFVTKGIFRPLEQFLVEPFAYAFGGKNIDGTANLEKVKWDLLIAWYQRYICGLNNNGYEISRDKIKKVDDKLEDLVLVSYRTIYLMHIDVDDYGLPVEPIFEWL